MIFKPSYIVAENGSLLRCAPAIDRRQWIALVVATGVSVLAGIAAFVMLSNSLPVPNRVSWSLIPPKPRIHQVAPPSANILLAGEAKTQTGG